LWGGHLARPIGRARRPSHKYNQELQAILIRIPKRGKLAIAAVDPKYSNRFLHSSLMKRSSGLVIILCTLSTAIGVSLASLRVPESQPAQPESQQTAEAALVSNSPAASSPASSSAPSSTPSSSQPPASPAPSSPAPALDDFPHQRLDLSDRAQPGADFYQFRSQLRQAIRDRNTAFVKGLIAPSGISIGYGRDSHIPREALDDLNTPPGSILWAALEHAIAIGCQDAAQHKNYPDADPNFPVWICPNVQAAFTRQYPASPNPQQGYADYITSRVIVVGERVNVRAHPDRTSPVVGQLSNEIVEFDRQTWERIPPEERVTQVDSPDSWTPVILPNQRSGYVSNRYAYFVWGTGAVFGKVKGNWQLISMPSGE
jgi:hypothetical protein